MSDLPIWVLDTNVVVSGLLSPIGPPGRLVDMVLARKLVLALDDRMEDEHRMVMARPKFGIEPMRQDAFLAVLQFQQHVVAAPWSHTLPPDPDDVVFLEVAMETEARVLVTGNARHFPTRCAGPVNVLSPRKAWECFA